MKKHSLPLPLPGESSAGAALTPSTQHLMQYMLQQGTVNRCEHYLCQYKFTQLHRSHQHPICHYILCTCHMKPRLLGFPSEGENKPSAHLPVISLQINNSFCKDNFSPVNFVRSSWWGEKSSSPLGGRAGRVGRTGRAGRAGRPGAVCLG